MSQKTTPENGASNVPLDKIVSWVFNEVRERTRIKARALESSNVQQYQFEAGYLQALSDTTDQIKKVS